jgi:hypothetical protein
MASNMKLYRDAFRLRLFVALTFRFDRSPFAAEKAVPKQEASETAKSSAAADPPGG